jgi:hypothetical protein
LIIIRVENDIEMSKHLYGFIAVISNLLFCIMERYQD